MYQKAIKFITEKCKGVKRRNGNPCIIHPIRVSQEVKSNEEKIVALLHDVVEDSNATFKEIKELFGDKIMNAVKAMTHLIGEDYWDYINRVIKNKMARSVKIADISDNLSDSPTSKAIEKYAKALDILINKTK